MDNTSYNYDGPAPNSNFSRRHVSSVQDIIARARDFSDLSNPDVVKAVCLKKVDTWALKGLTPADISVEQIMAGLTNQLFVVSVTAEDSTITPAKVLFRIYGTTVGDLYDTDFELTVFKLLSKYRAAPQLIGEFDGGRIEQFLDGPPLTVEALRNPSTVTALANILARFHQIHKSFEEMSIFQSDQPSIWKNLTRWASKAGKLAAIAEIEFRRVSRDNPDPSSKNLQIKVHTPLTTANNSPESASLKPPKSSSITSTEELLTNKAFLMSLAEKKSLLDSICDTDIHKMLDEIENVKSACLDPRFDPLHPLLQIVFCHNDIQENNILCTGSRLRLIDFEYANFNYAAFDIANLFCEMTMDYTVITPPCFLHTSAPEDFPSESLIKLFGSVYMSALTGDSYLPDDPRLDEFVQIVHRFVLASHLLWGYWSIVRAPQAATSSDFDYLMYAKSRFDAYKQWKHFLGL